MKYGFVVNATISLGIDVEADSLLQAIEKAQRAGIQGLCHQCSKGDRREWSTSGELDCGDPSDCDLVDLHTDDPAATFEDAAEAWLSEEARAEGRS